MVKKDYENDWNDLIERYKVQLEIEGYILVNKPVVPKFIANHYESLESQDQEEFRNVKWMLELAFCADEGTVREPKLFHWITENPTTYMLMVESIQNGTEYEVEEEQKYIVKDKHGNTMLYKVEDKSTFSMRVGEIVTRLAVGEVGRQLLTEQEIKDYDPRFWPFAKRVEELEE